MTGLLRLTVGVGVIVGWIAVLIWVSTSVLQIAVDQVIVQPCAPNERGQVSC